MSAYSAFPPRSQGTISGKPDCDAPAPRLWFELRVLLRSVPTNEQVLSTDKAPGFRSESSQEIPKCVSQEAERTLLTTLQPAERFPILITAPPPGPPIIAALIMHPLRVGDNRSGGEKSCLGFLLPWGQRGKECRLGCRCAGRSSHAKANTSLLACAILKPVN